MEVHVLAAIALERLELGLHDESERVGDAPERAAKVGAPNPEASEEEFALGNAPGDSELIRNRLHTRRIYRSSNTLQGREGCALT